MASELATAVQQTRFEEYCSLSAATLVLYDYTITACQEVQHVWKTPKTAVFYLFIVLRYSTIVIQVVPLVHDALSSQWCIAEAVVVKAAIFLNSLSWGCILVLRCFSIWNRSWLVSVALGIVFVPLVAITAVELLYAETRGIYVSSVAGISICYSQPPAFNFKLFIVFYALTMALDTLVVILTTARTVQLTMHSRKFGLEPGLSHALFRDGLLYFCAVESLVVLVFVLSFTLPTSFVSSTVSSLQPALTPVIVERLVLNLRQVDRELCGDTETFKSLGVPQFAHGSVIGNAGAPLRTVDELRTVSDEQEGRIKSGSTVSAHLDEHPIMIIGRQSATIDEVSRV